MICKTWFVLRIRSVLDRVPQTAEKTMPSESAACSILCVSAESLGSMALVLNLWVVNPLGVG